MTIARSYLVAALIMVGFGGVIFPTRLQAVNRVAVRAEAFEEFTKARALDPGKKVMTYQFMKGRYHPGIIHDPGMKALSFEEIIYDIALNLEKQNFIPVPEVGTSDILIVVHWGVTRPQEDSLMDMMGYTSLEDWEQAVPDSSGIPRSISLEMEFNANASLSINQLNDNNAFYKAQLLGMEAAYSDKGTVREEIFLKHMINEERYFIVLMAYDFQKLQKGEVILLWRTRYSIRALGQSFSNAIGNMNLIASDYFGTNMKELITKRVDDKSDVKMGDVEVIQSGVSDDEN